MAFEGNNSPKVLPLVRKDGDNMEKFGRNDLSPGDSGKGLDQLMKRLQAERHEREQLMTRVQRFSLGADGEETMERANRPHAQSNGMQSPLAHHSDGTLLNTGPRSRDSFVSSPSPAVALSPGTPSTPQQYRTPGRAPVSGKVASSPESIPEEIRLIVRRPLLPPSLRPDGYEEGSPAMPHAGHPDIPIEILPFVMLGTFKTASDNNLMTAMGISALLNCCSEDFNEADIDPSIQYLQCPFDDDETSLSLQRQKAMDLISSTRQAGGRVLMFCSYDWRCAVCIMYLMWECRLTLIQALALVQYKKSPLRISRKLCSYLMHYEAVLHGSNSMRLVNGLITEP